MDYLAITSTAAAGLSALAAIGSWNAARRANKTSAQAQATGERAYETANAVARIERDRRREERRPQFDLTLEPRSPQHSMLNVHLAGPDELGEVESVSIRVDDDDKDRTHLTPGGATREDIDNQIWGPSDSPPPCRSRPAWPHRWPIHPASRARPPLPDGTHPPAATG